MKVLDITEGSMYDISLYSNAQNKKVTKLENGKFLVSIPVSEALREKT